MYTITKLIFYCLLFCASISSAIAQTRTNVPYSDAKGNPQIAASVTVLTGTETELTSGWYLASSSLNYTQTLTMTGDVRLILENGCNMAVQGSYDDGTTIDNGDGIKIIDTNSLTIYAQSLDTLIMGKLTVQGGDSGFNRPGGGGIGNYYDGIDYTRGYVSINGGYITASSGRVGAGIGARNITINGGKIVAYGHSSSRGASPGIGGKDTYIVINGGDVSAISDYSSANTAGNYGGSAGIGGGSNSGGVTVIITGGNVTAIGGSGAGIGGASGTAGENGGTIIISGGKVMAIGGNGAGIGGGNGDSYLPGTSGDILIYGENTKVTARGVGGAMDIGAGFGISYTLTPIGIGAMDNVFVALPKGNLLGTDSLGNSLEIGNPVTFTANPVSSDTVTVTLPAPFDTKSPIPLLKGLGTGTNAKIMSVISSMPTQSFALRGYRNSPITQSDSILMGSSATVNFNMLPMLNNVPYLDEHGEQKIAMSVIALTANQTIPVTVGDTVLTSGWYLASDSVLFYSTITINGDVHLILKDNSYTQILGMVDDGIKVSEGNSLTIYAQSLDSLTMGKLYVMGYGSGSGYCGSGIGVGTIRNTGGNVTINGGNITAIGGRVGAGIYGYYIIINNGIIKAKGDGFSRGASSGIGGGGGSYVTINGGDVTAISGGGSSSSGIAAGIGGGAGESGGNITINGGKINASGAPPNSFGGGAAGIGDGSSGASTFYNGLSGNITITGGNVIATGRQGIMGENILIYGENTKVTASGTTNIAYTNNVFVALPKGNLLGTDSLGNSLEIGNPVTFTANPVSSDTVTVTLPTPFDTKSPIPLLKGLGTGTNAKIMSVISSMPTQSFALRGYRNSPISKTNSNLMQTGTSVNFTMYRSYIMVNGR